MSQQTTGAGIILCGGKSERMGRAKPLLPFGNEVLLQRVTRILAEVVTPLIVVASPEQSLPTFSCETVVVYDRHRGHGPLEGLAVGLKALPKTIDTAFVTGCDTPFINSLFVARILSLLDGYTAAIPKEGGRYHPLCAAFSRSALPHIEKMLAAGERRMGLLIESIARREVLPTEWCDVDPHSNSLRNVNNPEDYAAALREAGIQ
jgi:molybdopterin-guanine dinucleotide biosynthesis protein A